MGPRSPTRRGDGLRRLGWETVAALAVPLGIAAALRWPSRKGGKRAMLCPSGWVRPRAAPVSRGTTGSTANTTRRRADRQPRRRPRTAGRTGSPFRSGPCNSTPRRPAPVPVRRSPSRTVPGPGVDDGTGTTGAGRGAGTTGGASAARTTRRMKATSGSAGSNRPRSATGSGRSGSKATLRSTGRCSSASASSAGSSDCGMFVVIDAAAAAATCRKWGDDVRRVLLRHQRADEAALGGRCGRSRRSCAASGRTRAPGRRRGGGPRPARSPRG